MQMNLTKEKQAQPVRREDAQYETWAPAVDIYETKEGYFLQADMPGVRKENLDITVEGTTLTVTGKRELQRPGQPARSVEYRRVFEVDPAIDFRKVSARIEQGVVTVQLPKAEKVKPRKIQIGE